MAGNDRNQYFWMYSVLRTFLIKEIASLAFLARKLYHTFSLPLKGDVDKAYDVAVQATLCGLNSSDLNSEAQVYVVRRMPAAHTPAFERYVVDNHDFSGNILSKGSYGFTSLGA